MRQRAPRHCRRQHAGRGHFRHWPRGTCRHPGARSRDGRDRPRRFSDPRSCTLGDAEVRCRDAAAVVELPAHHRRGSALQQLLASARALADAPIWLVGLGPAIESAMPRLEPGQLAGVVVASVTSNAGSCSRSVFYTNSGNGAEPKVVVNTSGDACGASPPFGARRSPSDVVPVPHVQPLAPRIIEASIPADRAAHRPFAERLAEEIKATPAS